MPEKQKFGGNNVCMNYYTFNHLNQAKWEKKYLHSRGGRDRERGRQVYAMYFQGFYTNGSSKTD